MVSISPNRWIKINIIKATISEFARIFKLSSENKAFVNKKFDVLHTQKKSKWTINFISYAFSVFVVWHTVHLLDKPSQKKNRVIVNIRELNKIIEFDAYSMLLQSNIIFCVQKCKFIFIMNCATFFHQWHVIMKNRHKVTIVSHKKSE